MGREPRDHTLEYLLGYDGLIHWLDKGYSASLSRRSGLRRPARMVFDTRSPSMTARGAESWDSTTRIRRQSSEPNIGHLHKPLIIGIGLRAIEAGHTDLSTPKRWSKTSSEKFTANSRSGAFRPMLSTSRDERTEPCRN